MVVYDPLYGGFVVDEWILPVLLSPEVQRLSHVRLLNCPSPNLAAIGEVRRFSHTLGVLYLASRVSMDAFRESERKAFMVSVLLHDLGTPPFGHLLEYHIQEATGGGWHHEAMTSAVFRRTHAPEGVAHQFFANREVNLREVVCSIGVDPTLVEDICAGHHALSTLLFGSIDIDNIDNVFRMAHMMGFEFDRAAPGRLAGAICASEEGEVLLKESTGKPMLDEWAKLRRLVYEVLNLNPESVVHQAVLFDAIGVLVQKGLIREPSWSLTDEKLFDTILHDPNTKKAFAYDFYDRPPTAVVQAHLNLSIDDLNCKSRSELNSRVKEVCSELLGRDADRFATDIHSKLLAYSLLDRGTFEKEIVLRDPTTTVQWTHGQRSESTIIYVFAKHPLADIEVPMGGFLSKLGVKLDIPANTLASALKPFPNVANDRQQSIFNF